MTYLDSRRAFTLIELLVVCVVVALLASILMPALAGSKSKARVTVCRSNNRQIGLAMAVYTADSEEYPIYLSTTDANRDGYWDAQLNCGQAVFCCPASGYTINSNWVNQWRGAWYPNRSTGYNVRGQVYPAIQSCGLNLREQPVRVAQVVSLPNMLMTADCDATSLWTDGCPYPEALYVLSVVGRHDGRVVSGWCDGHVECQKLDSLKSQPERWNYDNKSR